ncbi:MAG TPA: hypothetical protein VGT41_03560 [Candidatus Babeliales bacterium]|nr:hypothetical protein [Candidatus Babeliales bacterium]
MKNRFIIQLFAALLVCNMHVGFAANQDSVIFATSNRVAEFYRFLSANYASEREREEKWQCGLDLFDCSTPEDQQEMLTVKDQYDMGVLPNAICDQPVERVRWLVERHERCLIDITKIEVNIKGNRLNLLELAQAIMQQGRVRGRDEVVAYLSPMFNKRKAAQPRVLQREEKEGDHIFDEDAAGS